MPTRIARHAAIVFAVLAVLALGLWGVHPHKWSGEAFGAFDCASRIAAHHEDPYLVEPLRSCEHRLQPNAPYPANVVEPAPIPGYAIAAFLPLGVLPFTVAAIAFVVLSLACVALTAAILAELSGVNIAACAAALVVVDAIINIEFGETPPIAIAALCLAALLVREGRDRMAALALAVAMIEPHLGLAACISLFVYRPRSRATLVALGVAAVAVSVVALSPATALEYVRETLPVHARAEVTAADQYSLTWLAHVAGADDRLAVTLGSISYAMFVTLGVVLAPIVARRSTSTAQLILFPTAASMLFGTFIHDIQIPAALPAVLVYTGRTKSIWGWIATTALAVSWQPWWMTNRLIDGVSALAVGTIAWFILAPSRAVRARNVALGVATYAALTIALTHIPATTALGPPPGPWPRLDAIPATAESSLNWGAHIRETGGPHIANVQSLATKAFVWSILAGFLLLAVRRRPSEEPPRVVCVVAREAT